MPIAGSRPPETASQAGGPSLRRSKGQISHDSGARFAAAARRIGAISFKSRVHSKATMSKKQSRGGTRDPGTNPENLAASSPSAFNSTSSLRSSDPLLVKRLEAEADERYQSVLLPINERMFGPLPQSETITSRPMVLLLGNHSSGKSTFINYLLNSEIQKSGVAPTDDCFTLITSGAEDTDQDGPALVGDPDLGFMALRNKGSALISHINLKVRKGVALNNVILVDSPGMIDCPAVSTSQAHIAINDALRLDGERNKNQRTAKVFDRGFDFMDVIKWFAEHSDVILLFFDPDKPGTTGETLECLTTALSGMEHKLLIVFNKCDQVCALAVSKISRQASNLCSGSNSDRSGTYPLPAAAAAATVLVAGSSPRSTTSRGPSGRSAGTSARCARLLPAAPGRL